MKRRLGKFGRLVSTVAAFGLFITMLGAGTAGAVGTRGVEVGTSGVFAIGPGHVFIDWVPGASSTLRRSADGVSFSLQTTGLPAGHAFTVWALIFNNPSACPGPCNESTRDLNIAGVQGSVQHFAGHVVGDTVTFAGRVSVGDGLVGNDLDQVRGPGLLDPYGAEIHLIVRDHGVVLPGSLVDQFNQRVSPSPLDGACNVACADVQKSVHLADA